MPVVPEGAIVACYLEGSLYGQQIILTHYYKVVDIDPPAAVLDTDLFDAIASNWAAVGGVADTYVGCTSESLAGIKFVGQVLRPTRYVRRVLTSVQDQGEVGADSLPPNVSHVVTLRSDIAGPTQRGNKHIAAVPPSFTQEGTMTPAGATEYNLLGTALAASIDVSAAGSDITLDPVVYHRANPALSAVVTNYILGGTTRVERRRTVGLGA